LWTSPKKSTQAIDFIEQSLHDIMEGSARRSNWNIAGYNAGLQNSRTSNVNKAEKTFANQGYLLRCIAMPLQDGCFHARVEITRYEDQVDMGATAFTPEVPFADPADAIEHARAWGVEWVRNNG
jgi:hypothetical protein